MSKKNDKKARLIQAAYQLFREKSYYSTTLAMIAEASQVPLGNVYYYFKSKDSLLCAVLEKLHLDVQRLTTELNEKQTQKERLKAYIQFIIDNSVDLAKFGDSIVTLSKELRDENEGIQEKLQEISKHSIKWVSQQFLGLASDPQTQSHLFLQRLHGIISMAMITNNPQYIVEHCERISSEI